MSVNKSTGTPQTDKQVLVSFSWDCGRMGYLDGLFVCTESEHKSLVGQHVDFGEALGKHSQVDGVIEAQDLQVKSTDQGFIAKLVEIIGTKSISGHNPLNYTDEALS